MNRFVVLLLSSCVLLGCSGAKSATGECLGWSCDEEGAAAMMNDTLASKYEPSDTAKTAFEVVVKNGVEKMKQQGMTPDSFLLAKSNLEKFLSDIPDGVDPLTPALVDLGKGSSRACSLWPYC